MLSTQHSTSVLPHVTRLPRRRSLETHRQYHLSATKQEGKLIIHSKSKTHFKEDDKIHQPKPIRHHSYDAKPIEDGKPHEESTSTKYASSSIKSNDNQQRSNYWDNNCHENSKIEQCTENNNNRMPSRYIWNMKKWSLANGWGDLTVRECDVSAFTGNTHISFPEYSSQTDSVGDIRNIIDRKNKRKRRDGCCWCCSPLCACLCLFGSLLVAIGITALLVSLLVKSNTTTSTSTQTTTRYSIFNVNMIINGDAGTGPCESGSNITSPTGWNYNGTITQIYYNNTANGDQSPATPGPTDRGQCYFYGQKSTTTTMWQTIDLINYVDPFLINTQTVNYNLSAWIGGYANQDDNAMVSLIFADQLNQSIGAIVTIGPVLAIDRANRTSLLFRQTNGIVPIGARFLTAIVTITRVSGGVNDGDVDNIALALY